MLSPSLTDHILRTFAAVPVPERVCVLGDTTGTIHEKLTLLGFESEPLNDVSVMAAGATHHPFGWAVSVFHADSVSRIDAQMRLLRNMIRPGGWVIVGVECNPEHPVTVARMAGVEARLERAGYGLAQEMVQHAAGYHLMVRRVEPDTQT